MLLLVVFLVFLAFFGGFIRIYFFILNFFILCNNILLDFLIVIFGVWDLGCDGGNNGNKFG